MIPRRTQKPHGHPFTSKIPLRHEPRRAAASKYRYHPSSPRNSAATSPTASGSSAPRSVTISETQSAGVIERRVQHVDPGVAVVHRGPVAGLEVHGLTG